MFVDNFCIREIMPLGIEVACVSFDETMAFARVAHVGGSGICTPWQLNIIKAQKTLSHFQLYFLRFMKSLSVRDIDITLWKALLLSPTNKLAGSLKYYRALANVSYNPNM